MPLILLGFEIIDQNSLIDIVWTLEQYATNISSNFKWILSFSSMYTNFNKVRCKKIEIWLMHRWFPTPTANKCLSQVYSTHSRFSFQFYVTAINCVVILQPVIDAQTNGYGHFSVCKCVNLGRQKLRFHAKQYHRVFDVNLRVNKWINFNQMNSRAWKLKSFKTNVHFEFRLTATHTILQTRPNDSCNVDTYHYSFCLIALNELFIFI